jgi:tetratricopeptide (TPR) repeat protein
LGAGSGEWGVGNTREPYSARRRLQAFASLLTPHSLLPTLFLFAASCGGGASPYERARDAWEQQDYSAAAAGYEEYLASSPEGPEVEEAEIQLADIYYLKLKQYDKARERYALFLERYPASEHTYDARQRLAEVNVALGRPIEAIAQYEEAVALRPDAAGGRTIRVAIADLYFEANNFSQAELEYGRVADNTAYDDLTEHSLLRTATIHHMIRDEDEKAIPLYERVAASTEDPVVRRQALYSLSDTYADLFRFDEAIAALGRVDDPSEAEYVAKRTAELEKQKRQHSDVPPEVDWSRGKGEG